MNGWQIFVEVPGRPPVELKAGESILGRSRTSQVHIPDSTVSRQHARVVVGGLGEVGVEDLGSSNGTYVNGEKIDGRRKLADGDKILIGDAELRVRIVAPVAAAEATVRMVLPPLGPPPASPMPPHSLQGGAPPAAPSWPPAESASSPRVTAPIAGAPPPAPPRSAPPAPAPSWTPPPPPPAPSAAGSAPWVPPPPGWDAEPAPPPTWAAAPAASAAPPAAPWTPPPAPAPVAPKPLDPPLRLDPPRPAAAPQSAPAAPAPAPAPPARRDVLPSVTAIERIPIPDAGPQAVEAARLARARPAGFWVRVVAMLVDTALVGTVSVALAAAFAVGGLTATAPSGLIAFAIWGVVMVVSFAYPIVFWATKGSTPGKMLFHLAVVTASNKPGTGIGWGPAIVRGLGYVASSAIFGVGFLLVAFTSQKQGLHDLIAGTRVLKLR